MRRFCLLFLFVSLFISSLSFADAASSETGTNETFRLDSLPGSSESVASESVASESVASESVASESVASESVASGPAQPASAQSASAQSASELPFAGKGILPGTQGVLPASTGVMSPLSAGGAGSVAGMPQPNALAPGAGSTAPSEEVMKDILDLKPIEEFTYRPWSQYLTYLLGALCLLITGALLFYLFKRMRKKKEKAVEVIPPDVEALKLLDGLETLMDAGGRIFYFNLSAVLRGYIGRRYEIEAMEMTSEELLSAVRNLDLKGELSSGIRKFVNTTDPVKFAGLSADRSGMTENRDFVRTFIEETRQVQEAEESAEQALKPSG